MSYSCILDLLFRFETNLKVTDVENRGHISHFLTPLPFVKIRGRVDKMTK